jgi:hypothetical protein
MNQFQQRRHKGVGFFLRFILPWEKGSCLCLLEGGGGEWSSFIKDKKQFQKRRHYVVASFFRIINSLLLMSMIQNEY